jgi:hypothetical protein
MAGSSLAVLLLTAIMAVGSASSPSSPAALSYRLSSSSDLSGGGSTSTSTLTSTSQPWVPLPPPIECGDVMQPNNTICIYLRNNCSDVDALHLVYESIPNNRWAVRPSPSFSNGTWFSFPSLSLAPNGTKGFAEFTANVFYNATLATGEQHEFGFGCIFSSTGFDCSFQPGKHFDADPDMQITAPSYVALLIIPKKKGAE